MSEIPEQLGLSLKAVNIYYYRVFSESNIGGDIELTHSIIRCGLLNAENLSGSE